MKYLLFFVWIELIILFASGCEAPRERRGDWLEHLNYRQFNFDPPMMHWDRHNYYTHEELRLMWKTKMDEITERQKKKLEAIDKRLKDLDYQDEGWYNRDDEQDHGTDDARVDIRQDEVERGEGTPREVEE